jgi:hypothetical protein
MKNYWLLKRKIAELETACRELNEVQPSSMEEIRRDVRRYVDFQFDIMPLQAEMWVSERGI